MYDDDDFFDDDLLQAVERYESSYKSQKHAPAQPGPAPGSSYTAAAQQNQAAPALPSGLPKQPQQFSQPLHRGNSNTADVPWQLFCSSVPPMPGGSSCTGWASRATKYLQPKSKRFSASWSSATDQQQQQQQQHTLQASHCNNNAMQSLLCQQQKCQQHVQHTGQQLQYPQHGAQQGQQQLHQQQHPWRNGSAQPGLSNQQQSCHIHQQQQQQCQQEQHKHKQHPQQWQQQHAELQAKHHSSSESRQWSPQHQQQQQQALEPWQHNSIHQASMSGAPAAANSTPASGTAAGPASSNANGIARQPATVSGSNMQQPGAQHSSAAGAATGSAAAASGAGAGSSVVAAAVPSSAGAGHAAVSDAGVTAGSGTATAASGGPAHSVLVSARLGLGPKGTIEVEFSSDHPAIANACGSILGATRGPTRGWRSTWLVPPDKMGHLEKALADLPANAVRVAKFTPLPDFICKILNTARKQPDDSELYDRLKDLQLAPGESLEQRMMPFQREGVKFGLRVGGRLLIGDEMGLGKTVQACALALCYKAEWPVLVITPSSLRLSWAAALYDWIRVTENRVLVVLKKTDMTELASASSEEEARSMYDFVVISYDMLKDCEQLLNAMAFKVVICDESHCIKNPKAARTQRALPLIEGATRAILLSGTPALSRPTELYTQLKGLMPKARIGKGVFEERYADIKQFGNFKKVTGSKNEDELNKLLTSTVMIRRRKNEVLKDLPPKMRKQVLLMLPQKQRDQLNKLKTQLQEVRKATANMYGVGAQVGGSLLQGLEQEQHNMIMNLYHKTAEIKADAVAEYVAEMVEEMSNEDDKFLVFAYHRELMAAIERGVNGVKYKNKDFKNLKYMRIDGTTPPKQREANVNMFQNDADCRIAILNIKAAGVGLTLTRASTVVFAELAWTPSEVQQAEDRAHRIGQTSCVSVQLLLVKDSIDELMWEMLQNKLAMTGQVLDGQAERLEVDKSGAAHRPKGAGANRQDGTAQEDHQQQSIKNFFTPSGADGGDGKKRQRLS